MSALFKWLHGRGPGLTDYEISASLESDAGCCRPDNEDCVRFFSPQGDLQSALAVVADGMGGHNAGELASQTAVEAIGSRYFLQPNSNPLRTLKTAMAEANAKVFELARQKPEWLGMGTTVTALLIGRGKASYAHVGDSRLYRVRGAAMEQLSSDHTLVAEMARDGLIPAAEIVNHPDRNVITRAIGTKSRVEVELCEAEWPVQIGDIYLLCSDGLYDLVDGADIESILRKNEPSVAAKLLVGAAKDQGGLDNISAIVLAIRERPLFPAEPPLTKL